MTYLHLAAGFMVGLLATFLVRAIRRPPAAGETFEICPATLDGLEDTVRRALKASLPRGVHYSVSLNYVGRGHVGVNVSLFDSVEWSKRGAHL
jgi:hypothetical protein